MVVKAIRGAITVKKNSDSQIENAAVKLVEEIINRNGLSAESIVFILFTCTSDLDAAYPAAGLRKAGYIKIPMLCGAEMVVKGSLEKCIRAMVLVNAEEDSKVRHVYLEGAEKLRPDLSGD